MDQNTTINCLLVSETIDIRTLILALSLIITTFFSILFYIKNRTYGFENNLNERLFQIQTLAFNNPFLEDKNFINQWDELVLSYRNSDSIEEAKLNKILQYEQYCEMIFNLISDNYTYKNKEAYLLKNIDFKSWARIHKSWWNNPLEAHSNRDTYGDDLSNILDRWIR